MINEISVVGGDLRIVKLIELFAKDGIKVHTYGLERAESLNQIENVILYDNIDETIEKSNIIITSIPLSSNNEDINMPFSDRNIKVIEFINKLENKTLIAGSIQKEVYTLAENKNLNIIDLFNREELTVLNTISTAEGAIQIAMEETSKTIHGSNVLIMGFGRIAKILSNMLKGIGANVYCETTQNVGCAWIKAYGYSPILLPNLDENLKKFDIIINTIPSLILDDEKLSLVKKECLIIDLASSPGGVDRTAAKQKGIKFIWALSLPGKVAPTTSAEFIKDTINNIFNELKGE